MVNQRDIWSSGGYQDATLLGRSQFSDQSDMPELWLMGARSSCTGDVLGQRMKILTVVVV